MKKRSIVGQRIVDVIQERVTTKTGDNVWDIRQIVLANGKRLIFSVVELDDDYAIEGFVTKLTFLKKRPKGHHDS
jgi:hypothetical protein